MAAHSIQLQILYQSFGLPRVGFVFEPSAGPAHDSVQDDALVVVLLSWAKPRSHRQLVPAPELLLKPYELSARPRAREVIAVHADGDGAVGMPKHAC